MLSIYLPLEIIILNNQIKNLNQELKINYFL